MTPDEKAELREVVQGLDGIHVSLLLCKTVIRNFEVSAARVDLTEKVDHMIETYTREREKLIAMVLK